MCGQKFKIGAKVVRSGGRQKYAERQGRRSETLRRILFIIWTMRAYERLDELRLCSRARHGKELGENNNRPVVGGLHSIQ